jgi:hypothetical protein
MPTWLVRFDKQGNCSSQATQSAFLATVGAGDDVILFSHGWRTRFFDAVDLYRQFLSAFEAVRRAHCRRNRSFVFVGVAWPSDWHFFRDGPRMAADGPGSEDMQIADALEEMAASLGSPQAAKLYDLVSRESINATEAEELARLLLAVQGQSVDDDIGAGATDLTVEDFLGGWRAAEGNELKTTDDGPIGRPGLATSDAEGPAAAGGVVERLNPVRALSIASLLQMKARAGRVGSNGVARLLTELLGKGARIHVVGHSFGSKVVLSATKVAGHADSKISSMVLLQPAVSWLSFATALPGNLGPAGYTEVPDLVSVPVVCTFSQHDGPLRKLYHLAFRRQRDIGDVRTAAEEERPFLALGGYGPADSARHSTAVLPPIGDTFAIPEGVRVMGFDGSAGNRIASHSDVATEDLAWLLSEMIDRAA